MDIRTKIGWISLGLLLLPVVSAAEPYVDLVRYEYDGLNRLKSASTGAGVAQEFTHDEVANRETEIRRNAPIGAPRARSDVYSLFENASLSVPDTSGVLANDELNTVANPNPTVFQIAAPLFAESFVLNEDGSFDYQPQADFRGDDEFAYQIHSDTYSSNVVRVRLTVLPENLLPVVNEDVAEVVEDQSVVIPVLLNDRYVDSILAVDTPFHGSAEIQGASILYTPNPNYEGSDVFLYQAQGAEGIASARVVVTVTPENDPPVFTNFEIRLGLGDTVNVPVLTNAQDPEGEDITVVSVSSVNNAILELDGGTVTYTPTNFDPNSDADGNDNLMSEIVTVTIEDASGNQTQGFIAFRTFENTRPVAVDDCHSLSDFSDCPSASTEFDIEFEQAKLLPVLANDFDISGEPLTITQITTLPSQGSATIQGEFILYTPNPGVENRTDTFQYEIQDSFGMTSTARVRVFIKPRDNAENVPVARDDCFDPSSSPGCGASDAYLIEFGSEVTFDVLANDFDPNGETLTIVSRTTSIRSGNVSILGNQIVYEADDQEDINGFQDTFSYTIENESGLQAQASVYLRVKPRDNIAPVARNDEARVFKDEPREIRLAGNDSDENFDTLSIIASSLSTPLHGSVSVVNGSTVLYTPPNNFLGSDSFTYEVRDGQGGTSNVAVVEIQVTERPNIVPILMDILFDEANQESQENDQTESNNE